MATQPDMRQNANGPRTAFNGLIFALIIFAVGIGATTGWMRYSNKRACGFEDAASAAMGALLPEFSLAGGLAPVGATPRFICPQCSSYCWAPSRAGSPSCPFCKQTMVQEVTALARAGGVAPVAGAASIIPIQAGTRAVHDNRGVCTNCHTVVKAAFTPAAAAQSNTLQAPSRVAAAAVPDALKPILIKPFGMEVGPAAGEGARVTGVMGNSNASKAGLVAGDVVVAVNGKKVVDAGGLARMVAAAPPEANAQLKIIRNGRLQKADIMVGEGEMEGFTPIPGP